MRIMPFRLMMFLMSFIVIPASAADWYQDARPLWSGIPVTVRFQPNDQLLADESWSAFDAIDNGYNDWRDDSEIGKINAGGARTWEVSSELAATLSECRHLNTVTEGAFDITVGPLRHLWRDAAKTGVPPTAAAIAQARTAIGPSVWSISGRTLTVKVPGVRFDFGGVIKGMAVDRVMTHLVSSGVAAAMVQCGGETGCFGLSPRGVHHVFGIPHPDAPDERMWCTISDPGQGFSGSTSGNYRNPIVIGDKPYYHIFDPRTGLPVDTHVLSVSVAFPYANRNGLADALTKVGAVLGWQHLLPLVERLGGQALVLVREQDVIREHASAGWWQLAKRKENP